MSLVTQSAWSAASLRRLFRIQNGGTPTSDPVNWDGGVAWVTPADLRSVHGKVVGSTDRRLTLEGLASSNAVVSPEGSIVLSTRAPIGYVARLGMPAATNQGCRTLVPRGDLDTRYFAYVLTLLTDELEVRGRGSTFMELGTEDLASVPVPVPPLPAQGLIADYLDRETERIDVLLHKNSALQSLMRERRASWLHERIAAMAGTPESWVRLKSLARVTVGIVIEPSRWYVDSGGVPALRGVNVSPGWVARNDLVRISHEGHAANRKSQLGVGDVVVVRTGQAGAAAVVPDWAVGGNCIDLLRVSPGERLLPEFLEAFLNSSEAVGQVSAGVVGAIQGHFNVAALRDLRIPALPRPEQARLAADVRALDERDERVVGALGRQNHLLLERRQALITAAVTGQLDVGQAA